MGSIRFLRTFIAVAQTGSFAKAANQVALTSPAVSQQMRALEQELNKKLFQHDGRQIVLTSAARLLVPKVEALLKDYDALRNEIEYEELAGTVTIGSIISALGVLSHALLKLKELHPKLNVRLQGLRSNDVAAGMLSGELQAGLMVETPGLEKPDHFRWTRAYSEPLCLIASARIATPRSNIPSLMRNYRFIKYDGSTATGARIEKILRRHRLVATESLELNSLPSIVELVRQNAGIAMVPLLKGFDLEHDSSLCILPLRSERACRHVGVMENTAKGPITATLRHHLLSCLR